MHAAAASPTPMLPMHGTSSSSAAAVAAAAAAAAAPSAHGDGTAHAVVGATAAGVAMLVRDEHNADKMRRAARKNPKEHNSIGMSSWQARSYVTCAECEKPRIVYSTRAPDALALERLRLLKTEGDYECGGTLDDTNVFKTRTSLNCTSSVEMAWYSKKWRLARPVVYCRCGSTNVTKEHPAEKMFKIYCPTCAACAHLGPITRSQKKTRQAPVEGASSSVAGGMDEGQGASDGGSDDSEDDGAGDDAGSPEKRARGAASK
jgi:hypothetical protein